MGSAKDCRLIFWGTPEFAVPALRSLADAGLVSTVVTQPDRPRGRGRKMALSAVKRFAVERGLPVLAPEKIDSPFANEISRYLPATFVVVAYGRIIPEPLLKLSARPALNVHPSLLPDLRGPSPIQYALMRGYTETGVSLIQLDAKMDHGPVVAQEKTAIDSDDTQETLGGKLSVAAARLALDSIAAYCEGSIAAVPQDDARATFSKLLTAKDGLLDLSLPAEVLHNRVRALNPKPGTYCIVDGARLKILKTQVLQGQPENPFSATPEGWLAIRCGRGSLVAITVQAENGRPMDSRDFLNGHPGLLSVS